MTKNELEEEIYRRKNQISIIECKDRMSADDFDFVRKLREEIAEYESELRYICKNK